MRLVEAVVKGESLSPLQVDSPFLVACLFDCFARWEDVPDARRHHERAVKARRQLAFLMGTHRLSQLRHSRCALMGEE